MQILINRNSLPIKEMSFKFAYDTIPIKKGIELIGTISKDEILFTELDEPGQTKHLPAYVV